VEVAGTLKVSACTPRRKRLLRTCSKVLRQVSFVQSRYSTFNSRYEPCNNVAVDKGSAQVILEPYFIAARDEFLIFCEEQELGNVVKKTCLECHAEAHDTERHFAGTSTDGRLIVVAPQMADLPEDTVGAIFAHEFGHVVDHLYPGRFVVENAEGPSPELVFLRDEAFDDENPRKVQSRIARIRQWEARSEHEIEVTADLIAERVLGHRIGYEGPCMLQGFNRGVRRPKKLR